jgi:hypothetical protein
VSSNPRGICRKQSQSTHDGLILIQYKGAEIEGKTGWLPIEPESFVKKGEIMVGFLEPGLSVFREAFLAIDRSSLGRLERHFTFFSTV